MKLLGIILQGIPAALILGVFINMIYRKIKAT